MEQFSEDILFLQIVFLLLMSTAALKQHACNQHGFKDGLALRNPCLPFLLSTGFHVVYKSSFSNDMVPICKAACQQISEMVWGKYYVFCFGYYIFQQLLLTPFCSGIAGSGKLSLQGNGRHRQECKQAQLAKPLDGEAVGELAAGCCFFQKTTSVLLLSVSEPAHAIKLIVLQEKNLPSSILFQF